MQLLKLQGSQSKLEGSMVYPAAASQRIQLLLFKH